jgi:AraC-like DNA-binding protein
MNTGMTVLWFEEDGNELTIDAFNYKFSRNQMIFLTEFHKIEIKHVSRVRFLRFNRSFFCIADNDSEVGCRGILFFGSSAVPSITIPEEETEKLELQWKVFQNEMQMKDELQLEMLQMMLKRLLILCTRIYKRQVSHTGFETERTGLLREFNFLVEMHFKTKHTVAEYADLLHKSPKTVTHFFARTGQKSPLQFIKERRMLEARRLVRYTEKPFKEIAYELGFDNIQGFSRFFKKQQQASPSEFRRAKEKLPNYWEIMHKEHVL